MTKKKTKRKALSKRVRFEVFKRDSFTCQYCGKSAPDTILHIDHIDPVSKGGNNDLLNLITSCLNCNSGKGARLLSDDSAIQKQQRQLAALNERREQLEMMLKWRDGLGEIESMSVDAVADAWESALGGAYYLNETGVDEATKLVRKFGVNEVLNAIQIASDTYIKRDADGKVTKDSVNFAWSKVRGICSVKRMPPEKQALFYIRGILRNRLSYINEHKVMDMLRDAVDAGADIEDLKDMARHASSWGDFESRIRRMFGAPNG